LRLHHLVVLGDVLEVIYHVAILVDRHQLIGEKCNENRRIGEVACNLHLWQQVVRFDADEERL